MNTDIEINKKMDCLKEELKKTGSAIVAFSGGVDSTFLLKIAYDVLKDKAIAVTAKSSTYPEREFNEAKEFAGKLGVRHIVINSEELEIEGFSKNPANRCYYCKKELYTKMWDIAKENNIGCILDGANADDTGDFRPGMKAARELNIISPLKDSKLTKSDIRKLSKSMGLPTWDKPSFACLSSRFPYGTEINAARLKMVEKAEQLLLDKGIRQVRVRYHEDIARIEVAPEEREKFFNTEFMDYIGTELQTIGFRYVTLDLLGYRTGSMNEVLSKELKDSLCK